MKLPTLVASDEELESALLVANIPTLLMVLIQLTGDRRWLGERYRPTRTRAMDDNTDGGLPTDVLDEIRAGALAALRQYREGREVALPRPGTEQLVEMMSVCMGEPVADEYVPMLMEEMGLVDRDTTWRERLAPHTGHPFEVLIIGAGFAGVCAAIKLGAAGISHPDAGSTPPATSTPTLSPPTPTGRPTTPCATRRTLTCGGAQSRPAWPRGSGSGPRYLPQTTTPAPMCGRCDYVPPTAASRAFESTP